MAAAFGDAGQETNDGRERCFPLPRSVARHPGGISVP